MVLGDHNQGETEGTERQTAVAEVIVHELYNEETNENDIALLRLNETQSFDCNVRPVCLPVDDVAVNMLCIATGWGSTRGLCQAAIHAPSVLPCDVIQLTSVQRTPREVNAVIGCES